MSTMRITNLGRAPITHHKRKVRIEPGESAVVEIDEATLGYWKGLAAQGIVRLESVQLEPREESAADGKMARKPRNKQAGVSEGG